MRHFDWQGKERCSVCARTFYSAPDAVIRGVCMACMEEDARERLAELEGPEVGQLLEEALGHSLAPSEETRPGDQLLHDPQWILEAATEEQLAQLGPEEWAHTMSDPSAAVRLAAFRAYGRSYF